jgi:hypothetical protein
MNRTQEEFDRLPALVSRSDFRRWTGLSNRALTNEVSAGRIPTFKPRKNGYAHYHKKFIARLCGFTM